MGPGEVRIIVVDNGSTDGTKVCAEGLAGLFGDLCVVSESRVGLCHARNRGLSECKTPWLINLDDDGISDSNFVEEAFSTITSGRFDCFGGVYLQYYEVKRPYWLPAGFGSNHEGEMDIVELKEGSISGGIAAYETKHLRGNGGFPVFLGMAGRADPRVSSFGDAERHASQIPQRTDSLLRCTDLLGTYQKLCISNLFQIVTIQPEYRTNVKYSGDFKTMKHSSQWEEMMPADCRE